MNIFGSAFAAIKPRCDDYGTDRLNYYYSAVIITFMAVTVTAKQYVGAPLQCWVPAQFTKAWEQYAESYCFVYNTYWVRPDDDIPTELDQRLAAQLMYYQWVPFIMALEAFLFHLPARIWGLLSQSSGLNLEQLVKSAQKADEEDNESRTKLITNICNHLTEKKMLSKRNRIHHLNGLRLSLLYIFTKMLYCGNNIMQFWMMNKFLKQPDHLWGASILLDIIKGTDWELSGNFPRIAMCDFQVRSLGNLQRYSVQCVLILNMFNEKIFLFLYWWIVLVGVATVLDAVHLIINTLSCSRRKIFIKSFVEWNEQEVEAFCSSQIDADMSIVLRVILGHSSEVIATRIIEQLAGTRDSEAETRNAVRQISPHIQHSPSSRYSFRSLSSKSTSEMSSRNLDQTHLYEEELDAHKGLDGGDDVSVLLN